MQPYLETLASVIDDPTSNLTAAVLLLAAVFLVLLIVVVLILVLIAPSHDAKPGQAAAAAPSRKRERKPGKPNILSQVLNRLGGIWDSIPSTMRIVSATLLVAITTAGTYAATGTDRYCAEGCHQMSEAAETWAASSHGGVRCVRCHEGRPVTSAAIAVVTRSGYVVGSLTGGEPDEVTIPGSRCLHCHATVLEGSIETTGGIRMDHAAPVTAGVTCFECHPDTGHAVDRPSRPSRMQVCLRCHDDLGAPSACETCHVGDIGNQPVFSRIYRQTLLPEPTCGGCHDESSCDACHGLRMPHSKEFLEGEHARQSGFELKVLCWRCHTESDCGQCHGNWDSHGADFVTRHQSKPRDSACYGCHASHEGPFCDRCH